MLAGKSGKLTAIVRGISTLDAKGLAAKDADLAAEGPANVMAHVTNSAKVEGTGVATITLSGGPSCITRTIGSATVSGCRSTQ